VHCVTYQSTDIVYVCMCVCVCVCVCVCLCVYAHNYVTCVCVFCICVCECVCVCSIHHLISSLEFYRIVNLFEEAAVEFVLDPSFPLNDPTVVAADNMAFTVLKVLN